MTNHGNRRRIGRQVSPRTKLVSLACRSAVTNHEVDVMARTIQEWAHLVRCATAGHSDGAVDEIASRLFAAPGGSTCVWHESHKHYMEQPESHATCQLCGGDAAPLALTADGAHELCAAYARRGRPTPEMQDSRRCPCAPCNR